MSKVAPFLAAMTGPTALAAGLGLTGVGMLGERFAQNRVASEQDAANAAWMDFQRRKQRQTDKTDAALRDQNYSALDDYLKGATQEARETLIGKETDRLADLFTADAPVYDDTAPVGDDLIRGADVSGSVFQDYAGKALAEATREAREMIKARAKTSAYGGSFGGMGTDRTLAGRGAGADIGFNNEMRGIDLGVLDRWQSVQPEMLQYESTGLGDLLSLAGSNLMGQGFFDMMPGAAAPAAGAPGPTGTPPFHPVKPRPRLAFGLS